MTRALSVGKVKERRGHAPLSSGPVAFRGCGSRGREERSGSILEVKRGTERLLAHGFFRRTGGTGSVNRRKRPPQRSPLDLRAACDRSEPDLHSLGLPSLEAALTSRTGPLPTPQSRRLASAPPAGWDAADVTQFRHIVKNRVRTCSGCALPPAAASRVIPGRGSTSSWLSGSTTGRAATSAAMTGRSRHRAGRPDERE